MRAVVIRGFAWLEERTGLPSLSRELFTEQIPASAGWPQAFGSVALFLCLIQAVTGVLLSLNYAGTPGDAYNSLTYIIREVPNGALIHGLHHWGASLLLIVTVCHMIQVFLYGAYKRPREATWMVGVCILLSVLGFSLTGYLLPWDNRAYWGTVVTTKIIGQTPFIGSYLQGLLGVTDSIGVITFARFYSLHVLILPALSLALLALHLLFIRRHGVTPAAGDFAARVSFYPEQVFKDIAACFLSFALLFSAAAFLQVPLERLADPTDASYVPRPEWYFLFLFQLLKFFKGSLEPIGSIVLPSLAVVALFCIPFLDRGRITRVRERTLAIAIVTFAIAGWTGLTVAALDDTPKPVQSAESSSASESGISPLSPEEMAGIGYFRSQRCDVCHNLVNGPPKPGPTLAVERTRRSAAWMIQHFKNPSQTIPGSNMPPIALRTPELNALSAFLLSVRPETAGAIDKIPPNLVAGAQLYILNSCATCHTVNGSGGDIGPKLNGLAARRSRDWIAKHFADPQQLSPGSTMPSFHFSTRDEDTLIDYLLSLP